MLYSVLRYLSAVSLALVAAAASAAQPSVLLKFKGAIGVDPLTAAGGVDLLNVVRGINPGGRAWVIRKLDATVYSDASIVVKGKGLLFSSGDVIATRGPVAQVVATLACGLADATAAKFTSDTAPLNAAGNFTIRGSLRDGFNWEHLAVSVDLREPSAADSRLRTGRLVRGGHFRVRRRGLSIRHRLSSSWIQGTVYLNALRQSGRRTEKAISASGAQPRTTGPPSTNRPHWVGPGWSAARKKGGGGGWAERGVG